MILWQGLDILEPLLRYMWARRAPLFCTSQFCEIWFRIPKPPAWHPNGTGQRWQGLDSVGGGKGLAFCDVLRQDCDPKLNETKSCDVGICPVDCQLGPQSQQRSRTGREIVTAQVDHLGALDHLQPQLQWRQLHPEALREGHIGLRMFWRSLCVAICRIRAILCRRAACAFLSVLLHARVLVLCHCSGQYVAFRGEFRCLGSIEADSFLQIAASHMGSNFK